MNQDKAVLILGSTSDIGNAIAVEYLRHNFNVILAARNSEALAEQKDRLSAEFKSKSISSIEFDGSDFEAHQTQYQSIEPIPEGVITVMGYLGEQKVSEISFKETHNVINANYLGNISFLNIVANDFEERGHGFIIGVSSVAADRGRKSNYIYGSAKAGFTAYLSGLRSRLFHSNVHVLIVHPGFVDTKMTQHLTLPKPLTAKPEAVAKAIYKAQQSRKNKIYTKPIWKYIMLIIKNIPEPIFKRLSL